MTTLNLDDWQKAHKDLQYLWDYLVDPEDPDSVINRIDRYTVTFDRLDYFKTDLGLSVRYEERLCDDPGQPTRWVPTDESVPTVFVDAAVFNKTIRERLRDVIPVFYSENSSGTGVFIPYWGGRVRGNSLRIVSLDDQDVDFQRRILDHMSACLSDGKGHMPSEMISAIVYELYSRALVECYTHLKAIQSEYKKHENYDSDVQRSITTTSWLGSCPSYSCMRKLLNELALTNPGPIYEKTEKKIREAFEMLDPPSGFGDIRSFLATKGSKSRFLKLLRVLDTMEKDEEFHEVILPYVKSIVDNTWRPSDRLISSVTKYDEFLCEELVQTWLIQNRKAFEALLCPIRKKRLPGKPEAIVISQDTGLGSRLRTSRLDYPVYPSVKVLVVYYLYNLDWLPKPEQFPNLEKVYYRYPTDMELLKEKGFQDYDLEKCNSHTKAVNAYLG